MASKSDRIKCCFLLMEYDNLTDDQHALIVSFEEFYEKNGFLTEKQLQILESIFKQAAEK